MTDAGSEPAIGFKFQVVFDKDAKRSLVFETFLPRDAPQAVLDEQLDKLRIAVDRQLAYFELEQAQIYKDDHARTLRKLNEQVALLMERERIRWDSSGKRGDWSEEQLPAKEREALKGIEASINQYRLGYERYARDEERALARLNGHANVADFGANRHPGVPNSQN